MSDDTWSAEEAMSKLAEALNEKGMSVDDMFAAFDADSDGTINGPELHHGIRDMVGDVLSPGQISVIIRRGFLLAFRGRCHRKRSRWSNRHRLGA